MKNNPKFKRSPELKEFGKFLKVMRARLGMTQTEAASAIVNRSMYSRDKHDALAMSQSLMAQLEAGKVRNPDEVILRVMAEVYEISYESIIKELVKDKYNIDPDIANHLGDEVLSTDDLPNWLYQKGVKSLWIIAPNFFYDDYDDFALNVCSLLELKIHITYFVNENITGEGGQYYEFDRFMSSWFYASTGKEAREYLHCRTITSDQSTFMSTGFIISNPQQALLMASPEEGEATGVYIMPDKNGKPSYGIGINRSELRRLVTKIWQSYSF